MNNILQRYSSFASSCLQILACVSVCLCVCMSDCVIVCTVGFVVTEREPAKICESLE